MHGFLLYSILVNCITFYIVFSALFWLWEQAGLTVRAVQKFLLGTDMSLFTTEHLDGNATVQPFPTTTTTEADNTDTYQSPPFTENLDSTAPYQVPIY